MGPRLISTVLLGPYLLTVLVRPIFSPIAQAVTLMRSSLCQDPREDSYSFILGTGKMHADERRETHLSSSVHSQAQCSRCTVQCNHVPACPRDSFRKHGPMQAG
jgi:hypothetical protein